MTQPHVPEQPGSGDINVGDVSGTGIAIGHGSQALVTIYQTVLRPLPVKYSALVQPLIEHYTAVFGGRDAELAALDSYLDDPQYPFGLLVAPTGLGKTALLVHWIARVQQQHPQWRIIFAPVSIRYQTASEQVALGLLAHSLAEFHQDLEQFRGYDQSPSSLRALITDYLRRPLPAGTQLLIVIDGIDEAIGWTVGPLCTVSPQEGLKIVVAARQRANVTRDDLQQQLGWATAPVASLDLGALDLLAVAALLRRSNPALADDPAFVKQFYRVSEGDPLTSNMLIKALNSDKITPDSLTQRPPGLEAFLKDWVETLRKRRQESQPIREVLALCAAANGPLTSDDLQALAPDVFVEQADIVDAVHDDEVARFIITVGEAQHTYVFSHQRLREVFLEQIYPPKDRERLQQRLITYGNAWYADRSQPLPDYLRQFWIAHLKAANEWERILQVVTEIVSSADGQRSIQPWQTARYAAEGSDTGYLSDLDLLWGWADDQGDLGLALRCALIAASLRSRSGNLTPELLVQLVKVGPPEGRWSAVVALEQIAHMPSTEHQKTCMEALLTAGIELPWPRALEIARTIEHKGYRASAMAALAQYLPPSERASVLAEALQTAQAIIDERSRASALAGLALHLSPELLVEALQAARDIRNELLRAEALAGLALHFPPHEQRSILQEAHRAASIYYIPGDGYPDWVQVRLAPLLTLQDASTIENERARATVLVGFIPRLSRDKLVWALQTAQAIKQETYRAEVLAALAPHLPPELLAEALQTAQAIKQETCRAEVLAALASYLSPPEQAVILAEALQTAQAIKQEIHRTKVLAVLAPHLPPKLLAEALQAARAIKNAEARAEVLAVLAPHLPPELLAETLQTAQAIKQQGHRTKVLAAIIPHLPPELLAATLQAARVIEDERPRAEVLAALAPHLSPSVRVNVLFEAFQAVCAFRKKEDRAFALVALAPHLPPELVTEAFHAAISIETDHYGAKVLAALAPHLPPELLAETLQTAQVIKQEEDRTEVLAALAPHLPPELLAEALRAAHAIKDSWSRARALGALTPYLPPSEQSNALTEALRAARAIKDSWSRARALGALTPYLPPNEQSNALTDALQAVRDIDLNIAGDSELFRVDALKSLAPHLPPDLLSEALQIARDILLDQFRASALAELAQYLLPSEQASVLAEALQAARAIWFVNDRASALACLMPHIPPTDQASVVIEALQSARAIQFVNDRASALASLAPYLPPELLAEVLQVACDIATEWLYTSMLEQLAPALGGVPANDALFAATLRVSARRGRPAILRDLKALTPWITTLAERAQQPAAFAALANAVVEAARCWP